MIWGGNRLHTDFGYDIPSDKTGECWAIGAHQNGDCVVNGGIYDGMTLSKLWNNHKELFGNLDGDRFPLLIKIIDANDDLSIQVHPDDEYAKINENGSFGKTECWYVLDAKDNATIVIGHNAKDKAELEDMILNKKWNEFIREILVKKGDFFQINPGCLHAIKGGTLILETQQNSDVTYRVYDYDRLSNGKPRDLHVKQSIDVIQAPFVNENTEKQIEKCDNITKEKLISCKYYTVEKLTVNGSADIKNTHPFINASVINGEGFVNKKSIKKGSHFIIPATCENIEISGDITLIISYV